MTGRFECWRRQQQSVGGHYESIGASIAQPLDYCVVAQAQRLKDLQPMLERPNLYGTCHRALSPASGSVGLGENQYDVMAGCPQPRQGAGGEGRCPGED
jgi:hypothetical protein